MTLYLLYSLELLFNCDYWYVPLLVAVFMCYNCKNVALFDYYANNVVMMLQLVYVTYAKDFVVCVHM